MEGLSYHSVTLVLDGAMDRGDVRRLLELPAELRERIVYRPDQDLT